VWIILRGSVYLASSGAGLAPYPVHHHRRTESENHWVAQTCKHSRPIPPSFPCRVGIYGSIKGEDCVAVLCGHKISLYTGRPSGQRTEDCPPPRAGDPGLSHVRTPPHLRTPPYSDTSPRTEDAKEHRCQMYGSRASLGPPRPRRSVASGSHQVAEVAIRHW